jgi:hypothetical protein
MMRFMSPSHKSFHPVPTMEIVRDGLCWEIDVGPSLFTLLQPEMQPELAGVINPSYLDHTKLSVWFQPRSCRELCSELHVDYQFSHYDNPRWWRMVSEVTSVTSPSMYWTLKIFEWLCIDREWEKGSVYISRLCFTHIPATVLFEGDKTHNCFCNFWW